jgi:protocatechuate 3,4-dioxygenase beta subunit
MRLASMLLLSLLATAACARAEREPVVGLPCEGCEDVFEGLPAQLDSRARITPPGEPGTPMVVAGRVLDAQGKPRAGVIVYAYQTNSGGTYPPSPASRHGLLRAWARTGEDGRYAFDTVRPGSYPGREAPEHIHMHVIEPGCSTYYIDDVVFTDDPKLTPAQRRQLDTGRGGSGVATPAKRDGTWHVARDIHLGRNVPGHRACDS